MILLTGATGLLGSHVLRLLIERGEKYRVLVRKVPRRSFLQTLDPQAVDSRNFDLAKSQITPALFEGVTSVIHCAAIVSPFAAELEEMRRVNVLATQKLYQAALKSGVKNWTQVSTVATYCDGESSRVVSEENHGIARATGYAATKAEIDQWLDLQKDGIRKIFIHPCYMLDEWDARPSSGAVLLAIKLGKVKEFYNCQKNFVAARDVAEGILRAQESKVQGHYLLGGENLEVREFFKIACEELSFSFSNLKELGNIADTEDPGVKEFCQSNAIDFSKATRDLKYQPTLKTQDIIRLAISYFIRFKMLRI